MRANGSIFEYTNFDWLFYVKALYSRLTFIACQFLPTRISTQSYIIGEINSKVFLNVVKKKSNLSSNI